MSEPLRILGIDPGSRITGFGIIDIGGGRPVYEASGSIRTDKGDFPDRLRQIFMAVGEVVATGDAVTLFEPGDSVPSLAPAFPAPCCWPRWAGSKAGAAPAAGTRSPPRPRRRW